MKLTEEQAKLVIESNAVKFMNGILGRVMTDAISMGDARKELHAWWAGQDADIREHWQQAEKTFTRISGIGEAFKQEFVAASLEDRKRI